MTYALGDVIASIGGASVVREHTPLNATATEEGAVVWSGTIPAGHILAVEITTNVPAPGIIAVADTDESWTDMQYGAPMSIPRMTIVTEPGHEGPARVVVVGPNENPFTVTGVTTTLVPI